MIQLGELDDEGFFGRRRRRLRSGSGRRVSLSLWSVTSQRLLESDDCSRTQKRFSRSHHLSIVLSFLVLFREVRQSARERKR